jgi:hypothetical protein
MNPEDLFEDEELLANLDLTLLDIQKDLVRIIVLVNSVLLLQGLTFLFLAWVVDGFLATVVIGLIGTVVFLGSLLIWLYNFQTYGEVFLRVKDPKDGHPGLESSDDSESRQFTRNSHRRFLVRGGRFMTFSDIY